jgi:hypothetical protein
LRIVVTAVFVAFVAFAIATSCSVQHRSQDFACTDPSQCATGRTCINGFCVDNSPADAATGDGNLPGDGNSPFPDAPGSCPQPCTSCDLGSMTCTIDCLLDPTVCASEVDCPPGYKCNILCNDNNACTAGVHCDQATACVINCTGKSSCADVVCGPGACTIACSGSDSCTSDNAGDAIDCSTSCACEVTCTGQRSCFGTVACPDGCNSVSTNGVGCEDTTSGCNSCP